MNDLRARWLFGILVLCRVNFMHVISGYSLSPNTDQNTQRTKPSWTQCHTGCICYVVLWYIGVFLFLLLNMPALYASKKPHHVDCSHK